MTYLTNMLDIAKLVFMTANEPHKEDGAMTRKAKRKFWQDMAGIAMIVSSIAIASVFFYSKAQHTHIVGVQCAASSINANQMDRCLAENM